MRHVAPEITSYCWVASDPFLFGTVLAHFTDQEFDPSAYRPGLMTALVLASESTNGPMMIILFIVIFHHGQLRH